MSSTNGNNTPPKNAVGDGRGERGRFAPGNKAGKGNPFNRRAQKIRAALMSAVKPADIREAVKALLEQAKKGDRAALSELLDRTIGRPAQADLLERIEALEAAQAQPNGKGVKSWN